MLAFPFYNTIQYYMWPWPSIANKNATRGVSIAMATNFMSIRHGASFKSDLTNLYTFSISLCQRFALAAKSPITDILHGVS